MTLEISPQHHAVVQGYNKMNLQHIRTATGTTIMFPDLTDPHIPPLRKNTISIRGSLDNVLQARLMLMVRAAALFGTSSLTLRLPTGLIAFDADVRLARGSRAGSADGVEVGGEVRCDHLNQAQAKALSQVREHQRLRAKCWLVRRACITEHLKQRSFNQEISTRLVG